MKTKFQLFLLTGCPTASELKEVDISCHAISFEREISAKPKEIIISPKTRSITLSSLEFNNCPSTTINDYTEDQYFPWSTDYCSDDDSKIVSAYMPASTSEKTIINFTISTN